MLTPYEYIKNHVNVKLAPSKIHGVGVFALKHISFGDDLFVEWKGKSGMYHITQSELDSLDSNVKFHLLEMCTFEKINEEYHLFFYLNENCHWIFKTPLHWVNSCSFNESPNVDKDKMKANRNIRMGEELFTKYGKYEKFKSNRTI